jgi:NitT/TauT family transport system substrate-binding protein
MPGYHLPYLGGVASGLFAQLGIDVEVADPDPGGPETILQVAAGGAEFCLTSVAHYMTARAQSPDLAARFVAVIVQRSPMSAIVRADSTITKPADLAGLRLGGPTTGPMCALLKEYCAALGRLNLAPAVIEPMEYSDGPLALARGEIDAIADYIDLLPRLRREAGVEFRAVPFGMDVYASGMVAADTVSLSRVNKMRAALVAALDQQRREPEAWLPFLMERWPEHHPDDVIEGWALAAPNIFTDDPIGSMDAERWERTVTFFTDVLNVPTVEPESLYRPELLEDRRRNLEEVRKESRADTRIPTDCDHAAG